MRISYIYAYRMTTPRKKSSSRGISKQFSSSRLLTAIWRLLNPTTATLASPVVDGYIPGDLYVGGGVIYGPPDSTGVGYTGVDAIQCKIINPGGTGVELDRMTSSNPDPNPFDPTLGQLAVGKWVIGISNTYLAGVDPEVVFISGGGMVKVSDATTTAADVIAVSVGERKQVGPNTEFTIHCTSNNTYATLEDTGYIHLKFEIMRRDRI